MPREKEPGMSIEEQKAALRLEETEAKAAECPGCAQERKATGDPPS